eukprot:3054110-Amphidinium_carterae.1
MALQTPTFVCVHAFVGNDIQMPLFERLNPSGFFKNSFLLPSLQHCKKDAGDIVQTPLMNGD